MGGSSYVVLTAYTVDHMAHRASKLVLTTKNPSKKKRQQAMRNSEKDIPQKMPPSGCGGSGMVGGELGACKSKIECKYDYKNVQII